MEKLSYGIIILCFVCNTYGVQAESDSGCSEKNSTASNDEISPPATYPFRTDLLTVEECNLYIKHIDKKSVCMIMAVWIHNLCDVNDENPRQYEMGVTYVDISCVYKPHAFLAKTTKLVRQISPQRAVLLNLYEWKAEEDPVTVDIVDPVRDQTIHLGVFDCQTPNTTAKVHELGLLPNVYSFTLNGCTNMTIQKKHFSRMPQLRMIAFYITSISALEPGTFTDLIHLRSLTLERDFTIALETKGHPESAYSYFATDDKLNYLYNLHCDCSFAWLRNFLEQKPFIIGEKEPGEVFIIGNYLSAGVERNRNTTDVFSVDCSRNITLENILIGSEFSYNVTQCNPM
ncbi:uncharacterized protein LOC129595665 [Paramacrobiotus metropolitanus]|uniref:uncharacterized protein LOC129595665 n=1 Tax=Paramacrobiotus metropolitanus TaxID=2943436 RepID=UPI002445A33B|nr:uncharacterized protein LOC129595665 [Paramacrobiotus metropolitanus]